MMGASTRNMDAMITSTGRTNGTWGEKKIRADAYGHSKRIKCVHENDVSGCNVLFKTDPVRPGKLWLFNLEVEESRHSDAIEEPGCEAGMKCRPIFYKHTQKDRQCMQQRPDLYLK